MKEQYRKPELSGFSMRSALLFLDKRCGVEETERFLEAHGIPRSYLDDPNNWVSFDFAHDLLALIRDRCNSEKACWEAGTYTVTKEILGQVIWTGAKSVGTPSQVFKQWVEHSKVYNRVGEFRILQAEKNRITLEYIPRPEYAETDKLFCLHRMGQFAAIPTIWGMPTAFCREIRCTAEGEGSCVYEFSWQERPSYLYPALGTLCGGLFGLLAHGQWDQGGVVPFWLLAAMLLFIGYLSGKTLDLRRTLRRNEAVGREQLQALEAAVDSISEKYVELQASQKALEEAHEELKKHRDHLEELVEERTRELAESKQRLEESYEKLQELDRMKMRFFTNVSHELRTPLTLTLSPVEAMLQGELGPLPEQHRLYLEHVHTNALRLLKLINNLLDLSKLEAGKMALEIGKYDLGEFVQEIVDAFRPAGEKRGIEVKSEGGPPIPGLYFDRDKMEKVLINLIGNALKFTPEGGTVAVRWEKGEDHVSVSVLDTGPGIPEKDLERIFDRFVQVDDSLSRKHGGTGIGLALAKEITELHGGVISAANRPEGGAAFTFTLPLAERELQRSGEQGKEEESRIKSLYRMADYVEEVDRGVPRKSSAVPEEASSVSGPEPPAEEGERHRVLVVEDNADMRTFIADCLSRDFAVRTAVDGEDGWRKIQEEPPDLVVSDIMMPNRNGYELCQLLKGSPDFQHVPIILLTSKSEIDMKVEGFEKGADDYLTKPFNPRELSVRVRNMIKIRSLEKQIQMENLKLQAALKELKETQSQLVHSEKMASLGVLSAGLVHEINNPLNAALSSLNTLARLLNGSGGPEAAPAGEKREKIVRTAQRALLGLKRCEEIVTGLRRFARKDVEGIREDDLHEGLEATLVLLPRESGKEISLHRDYRLARKVPCNLAQLNQVFMNLLVNASQAIQGKGDIWIRTEQIGQEAVVTVEDNGCGISPEKLPRIFEPFFTTKEVGQGTGLGLSISHRIVEEHGGRIEVESTPGKGSVFRIYLPMQDRRARAAEETDHGRTREAVGL
jgi:signal transduction histidine kinase